MKKNGVVCAIDVNDYDQDVIDLAASFSKQFSVDLDLVHVSLFPDPSAAVWPSYLGPSTELIRDSKLFKKVRCNVDDLRTNRHLLSGVPVEQIVGFVNRNQPRLLILGTHARQGLGRLLGSVAMKIMRRVPCPVMVLRQKKAQPPPENYDANASFVPCNAASPLGARQA